MVTSNKKKAYAFIQEYADVSKLSFDKDKRTVNRKAKRMLRKMATPNDESTTPFTMAELEKAIRKMLAKGAAGEYEIPCHSSRHLAPRPKRSCSAYLTSRSMRLLSRRCGYERLFSHC